MTRRIFLSMLGVFGIGNVAKAATRNVIGYATRGPNGSHAVFWCDCKYYPYTYPPHGHYSPSLTAREAAEDRKKFYTDVQIYEIME
jgi:hypothetical protein